MSSSAGKMKRTVGFKDPFDKRGWADFKRRVADYCRRKDAAEANRRSEVKVTRITKEEPSA